MVDHLAFGRIPCATATHTAYHYRLLLQSMTLLQFAEAFNSHPHWVWGPDLKNSSEITSYLAKTHFSGRLASKASVWGIGFLQLPQNLRYSLPSHSESFSGFSENTADTPGCPGSGFPARIIMMHVTRFTYMTKKCTWWYTTLASDWRVACVGNPVTVKFITNICRWC